VLAKPEQPELSLSGLPELCSEQLAPN
jgi:hypothetical protein